MSRKERDRTAVVLFIEFRFAHLQSGEPASLCHEFYGVFLMFTMSVRYCWFLDTIHSLALYKTRDLSYT